MTMPKTQSPVTLRRAMLTDVDAILSMVNDFATQQVLLSRSPASVIERIREFVVAEVDGEVVACGALRIIWSDLGEVRSLVVRNDIQQGGIGRRVVQALIDEAEELGLARVFAFTYVVGFFERCGFHVVEHAALPHKVFTDCMNCPKFQRCDEVAMLRVLRETDDDPTRGPLSRPHAGMPLPRPVDRT